jgi:uroporphyrinogen-III synthase
MTILVIRNDDQFSSLLREAGFEVVNLELIETKAADDLAPLREKLARLSEYDGIFFTSPVAAEIFVNERNGSNGFHGDVYALGQRARKVLSDAGLSVKTSDAANTADELLASFNDQEFAGKHFLFVRGEKSIRTIPERLDGKAVVDEVEVYKTEAAGVEPATYRDLYQRLKNVEIDRVCFFSPSAVERFTELFGDHKDSVKAAAIGTTTADAARQAGFDVDFISPRSNAEDFAGGLIEHTKTIE